MPRELRIDRAIYLVDDENRTYRFLRRNLEWENLPPDENDSHKRQIDDYTRIFRDGHTKTFRFRGLR